MEILFENRECLACVKEPGILSQKGKPGEKDMVTELQRQYNKAERSLLLARQKKEWPQALKIPLLRLSFIFPLIPRAL